MVPLLRDMTGQDHLVSVLVGRNSGHTNARHRIYRLNSDAYTKIFSAAAAADALRMRATLLNKEGHVLTQFDPAKSVGLIRVKGERLERKTALDNTSRSKCDNWSTQEAAVLRKAGSDNRITIIEPAFRSNCSQMYKAEDGQTLYGGGYKTDSIVVRYELEMSVEDFGNLGSIEIEVYGPGER